MKTSSNQDRLRLTINLNASNPQLLEGLETWLQLGLLSHAQVKELSNNYLTCPLPTPVIASTPKPSPKFSPPEPEPVPLLVRISQSLKSGISVRWLLLLGVFMVVISSSLLVASNWALFPATAQYLVLFGYTLVFWLVSQWTKQRANLTLTAQSLGIVTLLLVPINFWAMDGFGLGGSPWGWGAIAITTPILTLILGKFRGMGFFSSLSLFLICYLQWGWSFASWPLMAVYLATLATVGETVGKTMWHRHLACATKEKKKDSEKAFQLSQTNTLISLYALAILFGRGIGSSQVDLAQLGLAIGLFGWLLTWLSRWEKYLQYPQPLMERVGAGILFFAWLVSVFAWLVSVEEFPLQAICVCGLALSWLGDRLLACAPNLKPAPRRDLSLIFAIGLHVFYLTGTVIPDSLRETVVNILIQLIVVPYDTEALLSLIWFPYLLGMLWVTGWLYNNKKRKLARFGDKLTLGFGIYLTLLAFPYLGLLALNLLFSTVTLAIVSYHRYVANAFLIYLTHICGLLTVLAWIDWQFPGLAFSSWIVIFLSLMLMEWTAANLPLSIKQGIKKGIKKKIKKGKFARSLLIYQRSAWHLGLVLAIGSYLLLVIYYQLIVENSPFWSLLWLVTPLSLTVIAGIRKIKPVSNIQPIQNIELNKNIPQISRGPLPRTERSGSSRQWGEQAAWFSTIALIMAQVLTILQPGIRLIALGFATLLMFFNTFYIGTSSKSGTTEKTLAPKQNCQLANAAIALGFGLGLVVMLLWEGKPEFLALNWEGWLMVGSLLPTSLWFIASDKQLGKITHSFAAQVYAPVADGWAKLLAGFQLLILSFHSFLLVEEQLVPPSIWVVLATVLLIIAITARTWQRPGNVVIYILGWSLEVLTIEVLGLINLAPISLAIVNIGLGLLTQLVSNLWHRHLACDNKACDKKAFNNKSNKSLPQSIEILPLFYGAVAIFSRWNILTHWTAFSTLGLAFIALGTAKKKPQLKFLTYLGLLGVSLSVYEFLWVQIESFPIGDRWVAMAALATAIMSVYRFWFPFLSKQLGISSPEVKLWAHLHWLLGSFILLFATVYPVTFNKVLALETAILLTSYAIFQGRLNQATKQQQESQAELWIYAGIIEGMGVVLFASYQLQLGEILLPWSGAIAATIASSFYFLPWLNWGWSNKPWQRSALVIPFMAAVFTSSSINSIGLGALILCYTIFAVLNRQIRLTYISLFFLNWLILRQWFWLDDLWLVTPPMLSLLYLAQVDPHLKQPSQKNLRHYLRLLATGIICLVALVTTNWLVTLCWSVLAIFAGLSLRIRAFLYLGTFFLFVNMGNRFLLLSYQYAFVKWAMGLALGLLFIWIAASFETRREQIVALLENWIVEFKQLVFSRYSAGFPRLYQHNCLGVREEFPI